MAELAVAQIRLAELGERTLEPSAVRARSHRLTEAVNLTLQATFARWLGRAPEQETAARLYAALSAQARAPVLFAELGVPDTLDGRFDSLCLHMSLVIRRLARDRDPGDAVARRLYDCMFKDMDASLRELGVGDLGVGKRVREMAEGLMGRIKAYGEALDSSDPAALDAAVRRNLLGTLDAPPDAHVVALRRYVRASDALLAEQPVATLLAEGPRFAACESP
jgi:cytochrome b pre-mRNA-processing protein 3